VLLVDDQELVRSGLRRILRRKDGFVIVAECSDGDEVPDAVAEHRPDVVVMDLRMSKELCISELTVKSHIGRIFVKLDLRDGAAAIVYASDHGSSHRAIRPRVLLRRRRSPCAAQPPPRRGDRWRR
jgi:DNA-binding NarL/FixJ family response regulator